MAEELQSLIERIQKDGVDKAEAEAKARIKAAEEKAAAIVSKAEEEAEAKRKQAEQDAESFRDRGEQALRQAARDLLLSVGQALDAMLTESVKTDVAESLAGQGLGPTLIQAVEGYFRSASGKADVEALLPEDRKKEAEAFLSKKFADRLGKGLSVRSDSSVVSGFRLSVKDSKVQHDFTGEALAEALASLLRPRLAAIVKEAAGKM